MSKPRSARNVVMARTMPGRSGQASVRTNSAARAFADAPELAAVVAATAGAPSRSVDKVCLLGWCRRRCDCGGWPKPRCLGPPDGLALDVAVDCQARGEVGLFVGLDDHDVAVDNLNFVYADGEFGRRCVNLAGPEIELGGVQRALDLAAFHPAVGQRGVLVGAGVVDGEELALFGVKDSDGRRGVKAQGFPWCQFAERACLVHGGPLFSC